MKKKKLIYIRGLMATSLLLLSVLIGSWLDSQYKEQKQQLQKDLQNELDAARKEVTDSILYFRVINPIVKIASFTDSNRDTPKHISLNSFTTSGNIKIVISSDEEDSNKIKKIKQKFLTEHHINLDDKNFNINMDTTGQKQRQTYTLKDSGAQDIVKEGLTLVMEEIFKQAGIPGDSAFMMDTAHLHHLFAAKLAHKNWHFLSKWDRDINYSLSARNAIHIETSYLSQDYNVAIKNYSGFLLKKILPQAAFSFILLLFVAGAFYLSLRNLKEQMRLSTMKNDLISNMSHELKTPISTVKVALEALTTFNMAENPQTTREYLEMAALEMNRLDMLVNQALNTALLEEGKIIITKECTDLRKTVDDVVLAMQLRLRQNNARLTIHAPNNQFTTLADPLHIQGVLINLIDNSLKYAGKEPVIDVSLESGNGNISISIADNGPGIPPEHIAHVFDKFYRVPHGDSHDVKGYGLGLSYSKQVMLQHNGTLAVKNLPVQGCMFTLTLPEISC